MRNDPKDKHFVIHDTTISIWREHAAGDLDTYESVRIMMVRDGFRFHQDPEKASEEYSRKQKHRSLQRAR